MNKSFIMSKTLLAPLGLPKASGLLLTLVVAIVLIFGVCRQTAARLKKLSIIRAPIGCQLIHRMGNTCVSYPIAAANSIFG